MIDTFILIGLLPLNVIVMGLLIVSVDKIGNYLVKKQELKGADIVSVSNMKDAIGTVENVLIVLSFLGLCLTVFALLCKFCIFVFSFI